MIMGCLYEFLECLGATVIAFDSKNERGIVAPRKASTKLYWRYHLDGVDAELLKIGELFDGTV